LLRSLIAGVVLTRHAPGLVEVRILWISGHYSVLDLETSIECNRDLPRFDEMLARIQTLWRQGYDDAAIAKQLTAEGFRSARTLDVNPLSVRDIRLKQGWRLHDSPGRRRRLYETDDFVTLPALAERLGVSKHWVSLRIQDQQIDPTYVTRRQPYNTYLIKDDPKLMAHLRQILSKRHQRT
jgi:hypothetical protein